MLFRARHGRSEYALTLRGRSFSASLDERVTVAADMSGRFYSCFADGLMRRRALDGRILQKWRSEGRRRSRWLTPEEAADLVDESARFLAGVDDLVDRPGLQWDETPGPDALAELHRCLRLGAAFDREAAARDAARFQEVYAPIGILPPDHYLSLVLQATEGCSFGTCAFCNLYPGSYRVKTVEEFRAHLAAVRDYFGPSLALRGRRIFLGAANALAVPMGRLVPLFEEIVAAFGSPPEGIHAFVDGFTGERKSSEDYLRLRQRGLRRVYLGLESGHDPLLEFVSKPALAGDVLEAVRRMKAAGLSVAVIVMIGLGGRRFAAPHESDTIGILNAMDLGGDDLLYFSDLIEEAETSYPTLAQRESLEPLTPEEMEAQQKTIRSALVLSEPRPRIASYDVRDFLY